MEGNNLTRDQYQTRFGAIQSCRESTSVRVFEVDAQRPRRARYHLELVVPPAPCFACEPHRAAAVDQVVSPLYHSQA
jgi:hypothetical protein